MDPIPLIGPVDSHVRNHDGADFALPTRDFRVETRGFVELDRRLEARDWEFLLRLVAGEAQRDRPIRAYLLVETEMIVAVPLRHGSCMTAFSLSWSRSWARRAMNAAASG